MKGSPKFLTLLFLRAMLSDPGRPSRILPFYRSLRIGFRLPNVVATCSCDNEAESPQGDANPLTAHRIPCVRFVWVVRQYVYPSQSRNTRYGWLAKPYPMETFTPKEAPSLLGALGNRFLRFGPKRHFQAPHTSLNEPPQALHTASCYSLTFYYGLEGMDCQI